MVIHLFDGTSWGAPSSSTPSDNYTIGNRFGVQAPVDVTGLRWYRADTINANKPVALRFWRADGTQLAGPITPPDNGAVGWQLTTLTTPISLAASTTYVVSMDWPAGVSWYFLPRGSVSAPPTGYLWDDNLRCYHVGGYAFPATFDNVLAWAVDIETGGTTGGGGAGGGGGGGTVDLAPWLSTDAGVQTHQLDGIPSWLYAYLHALRPWLGEASDWTAKLPTPINFIASAIVGRTASDLNTILAIADHLSSRLVGSSGGGGSAFYTASGTLTSDVLVSVQDTLRFMRDPLADFPTIYTLVDERDYDGSLIWTVQADVFLHQITAWPVGSDEQEIAGRTMRHRAGWWAPQAVSLPQARRFLEFDQQLCEWLPRRMKGGVFHLKPGYAGHVQAFTHV